MENLTASDRNLLGCVRNDINTITKYLERNTDTTKPVAPLFEGESPNDVDSVQKVLNRLNSNFNALVLNIKNSFDTQIDEIVNGVFEALFFVEYDNEMFESLTIDNIPQHTKDKVKNEVKEWVIKHSKEIQQYFDANELNLLGNCIFCSSQGHGVGFFYAPINDCNIEIANILQKKALELNDALNPYFWF